MRGTQPGDEVEVELRGIIPAYAGNTNSVSHTLGTSGDHPRVCGEHRPVSESAQTLLGSSPRMRGTPAAWPARSASKWIIPAYAGNTICRFRSNRDRRDHPRVCGEHSTTPVVTPKQQGSSPRMRGTHSANSLRNPWSGIIPAYAGNTSHQHAERRSAWDHPRVCGEHHGSGLYSGCAAGSSPRMRGTHRRGTRSETAQGIIPAYAGNTSQCAALRALLRDHPRVCGEHWLPSCSRLSNWGSSPRMRGTPKRTPPPPRPPRIIPAYAGNTSHILRWRGAIMGSSPRMRGTRLKGSYHMPTFGIIPAYAGNTCPKLAASMLHRDHPRVCGEHTASTQVLRRSLGSSPRMRGTLLRVRAERQSTGIIPAYAGNTSCSMG